MKVLYVVTAFPRSEADIITPWLTEMIHRLGARGTEVEVLAPSYRGLTDQVVRGVRVHRFRYAPRRWEALSHDQTAPDRIREHPLYASLLPGYVAAGSRAARRLARTGEFDAVHAFWPLPHGLLALAAKRATGIPVVCTFFGVELTWTASRLRVLVPVLRRIVRGSDAVTAISTHTADLLTRLAPGARPTVIPFGAAIEAEEGQSESEERLHAGLRVLFVGRLVERKGVHVLLDAVARLPEEPPIHLDMVGDGPDRRALEHRARSLGIADRVAFRGFVSDGELRSYFAGCDVLALPAVVDAKGDVEGLGVVLLEAMSFGKPVIASEVGGITDVVRNERNGVLVPPGDPAALAATLEDFARNPSRVRRLGENASRDVRERFSWESVLDRVEALYRGLLEPQSPTRE